MAKCRNNKSQSAGGGQAGVNLEVVDRVRHLRQRCLHALEVGREHLVKPARDKLRARARVVEVVVRVVRRVAVVAVNLL